LDEAITKVTGGQMYYRHNGFDPSRPTVLFIHGIGESGLCFLEAFHDPRLDSYNIIIPDLIGFGKSSAAEGNNYTFSQQILRLDDLLDELGVSELNLVGHSMGGIIGTLYCDHHSDNIQAFVNIEGDLTSDSRFVVESALRSDTEGRFEKWLRDEFTQEQVVSICHQWPSTVRYLASLNMCRSEAFLGSAYEIDRLIEPLPQSNTAIIGETYLNLKIPRVFCWGTESLSDIAREFLDSSKLNNKGFPRAFHWVMLDQTEQFYDFLSQFLTTQ
jgi:pimeloyl-ACP methyl ester carboxylesterase